MSESKARLAPGNPRLAMLARARNHPQLVALGAYGALFALLAVPLLARLGTAPGGGPQGWRTLWSFWWWHDSLARGVSPLACDALRWPARVPVWLSDHDLPTALAALPLWAATPLLPEVALHNLLLLAGYALAGFSAYLLCQELWGGHLAPFFAGALAVTGVHAFSFGHPAALAWPPLFFLGLVRTVRRRGPAAPLFAGAALALTLVASRPLFLASALGAAVLLAALGREAWALAAAALARRAALLVATFLALAGWFGAGLLRAAHTGPWVGGEAPGGADLLALLAPGGESALGRWLGARGPALDGAPDLHPGYLLLGLALLGGARAKAARPWLAVAGLGLVLSLGPTLRVGGASALDGWLPYAWLERALPALRLWASPSRCGFLLGLGLAVAAGGALSALSRSSRRGRLLACALALLALGEGFPAPLLLASLPAPRFLRDLARDPERWTVLDATGPERSSWHQVLHGHPQVGGASMPVPADLERLLVEAPALRAFFAEGALPPREEALRALQELRVRFVIVDASRLRVARALKVPLAFEGEGIAVFEVPPRVSS
ncbi:MAG TPA: hypothetical protein VMG32_14950, partial [Anaeromyxobacteraceae bacterium]|nr:hypothetical protein [Anaeromyxobacteraceae bacterium]